MPGPVARLSYRDRQWAGKGCLLLRHQLLAMSLTQMCTHLWGTPQGSTGQTRPQLRGTMSPVCVRSQVDMEQDYVTAAFFRHAIAQRQQHLQQLEDMQQIMDGGHHACLHAHVQCT